MLIFTAHYFYANDCFVYFQWQQSAGTCQFQIKVCGFRQPGATQDNWLFTQHISKSFDANTNNYPVEILVDITYALQSCRSDRNPSCNTRFTLYRYITNETQLPSTSGSGFMNKDNYVSFGTATPEATGARYIETHRFTLQLQQTGFYITIEDTGTCVIISRLLVYRHNCKSMQTGLVLYPETPAPVSGSSNIDITCVPNADSFGSPQVTCDSDGEWGPQNPRCECRAGYEDRGRECRGKTIKCFSIAVVIVFRCELALSTTTGHYMYGIFLTFSSLSTWLLSLTHC